MKSLFFFFLCLFSCYSYVVWTSKAEQNFKNSGKAFVKALSIGGRKPGTDGGCMTIIISNASITMRLIGSEPPDCNAQRERCAPCKPVLVKVPLDTSGTVGDYYPEVWMCGCSCNTR
ncbi:UNVERIFIED_CONTAM: hypothetical protein Scaly_2409600 [Sesamum calycinum]|uniref:Epidermal patterning factor-like protein n=1 Tax=Sesamum calycinum TaxID=2727403 RepID=A0AAW2LZ18_9LAMI